MNKDEPNFHPNRIVLSLDGTMKHSLGVLQDIVNEQDALDKELIWGVKLNSLLLHDGIHLVRMLNKQGVRVMADPKLFDIDSTMAKGVSYLHLSGADIITVHGLAGFAVKDKEVMQSMACVTVLTSWTDDMCKYLFQKSSDEVILMLASFAEKFGYGYIVCAPTDLELLKDIKIKKICPGVRPDWYNKEDEQQRVMDPYQARLEGADLLVVGRPILEAPVPIDALLRLNEDMGYI